jgi:hypothetical protein
MSPWIKRNRKGSLNQLQVKKLSTAVFVCIRGIMIWYADVVTVTGMGNMSGVSM